MNENTTNFFIIGITCFLGTVVGVQEGDNLESYDLPTAISVIMESPIPLSAVDAKLKQSDPNQSLSLLKNHVKDEKLKAMKAVQYINRVAQLHPQTEVRKQVVDILVMYHSDSNVGRRCYGYLIRGYQAKDFSESSKDIIKQELLKDTLYVTKEVILLSGMANIQDQRVRLNEIIAEDADYRNGLKPVEIPFNFTKGWYAHLARARMGVQEEVDWCVSKIEEEIAGNPVYSLRIFDDLGYIRHPKSVELLKKYFLSDRKIPPAYGREESYTSYLLPIISKNLVGFPELKEHKYRSRMFTPEEIEICKGWVRSQTEFTIRR